MAGRGGVNCDIHAQLFVPTGFKVVDWFDRLTVWCAFETGKPSIQTRDLSQPLLALGYTAIIPLRS
jgi:hypothetical protein